MSEVQITDEDVRSLAEKLASFCEQLAPGERAAFEYVEQYLAVVADGDAANRELVALLLASLGAEVSTAESGAAALARLAEHPIDILLLDPRMPDLKRAAVLRRLRTEPGPNQDVPVLALSAEAQADARDPPDGFDAMICKPIDVAALAAALSAAVNRAPP